MMVRFDSELYKVYERWRTELGRDVAAMLDSSVQLPAARNVFYATPYEQTEHDYKTLPVVAQP